MVILQPKTSQLTTFAVKEMRATELKSNPNDCKPVNICRLTLFHHLMHFILLIILVAIAYQFFQYKKIKNLNLID